MPGFASPSLNGFAIFGSLAILTTLLLICGFRSMTLRRQVSLGLLFSEKPIMAHNFFDTLKQIDKIIFLMHNLFFQRFKDHFHRHAPF